MVARANKAASTRGLAHGVFAWWRRFLGQTARESAGAVVAATDAASVAFTEPSASSPLLSSAAVVWAWAALVLGALLGVTLASPGDKRAALGAAALTLLWAPVRYGLMRFALRDIAEKSVVRGGWAIGCLPWAIAVEPASAAVAFVLSAPVTWAGLEMLGVGRRDAARAVALAWGAQLAITLIAWVARNAFVLLFVGR